MYVCSWEGRAEDFSPELDFISSQLLLKHYPAGHVREGDLLELPCKAVLFTT